MALFIAASAENEVQLHHKPGVAKAVSQNRMVDKSATLLADYIGGKVVGHDLAYKPAKHSPAMGYVLLSVRDVMGALDSFNARFRRW
jgi:hypothetical protein